MHAMHESHKHLAVLSEEHMNPIYVYATQLLYYRPHPTHSCSDRCTHECIVLLKLLILCVCMYVCVYVYVCGEQLLHGTWYTHVHVHVLCVTET